MERGTVFSSTRPWKTRRFPVLSVSKSASLLGLSRTGELALVLRGSHGSRLDFVNGMLARAPLAGGMPREILQDVRWADWDRKGNLAVVHHASSRSRLEFPIGKVL